MSETKSHYQIFLDTMNSAGLTNDQKDIIRDAGFELAKAEFENGSAMAKEIYTRDLK